MAASWRRHRAALRMVSRLRALFALIACLLYSKAALATPQVMPNDVQNRTEHLDIRYPADAAAEIQEFLHDAESIYRGVQEFFGGTLPFSLAIRVTETEAAGDSDGGLRLSLRYAPVLRERFAAELARLAAVELAGRAHAQGGARFLVEGLSAWVAARSVGGESRSELRWRRAAYGYLQEAAYLEYLESFDRASEDLGERKVVALGFTFADVLVENHGRGAIVTVLRALGQSADLCEALERSGVGCEDLLNRWWASLATESARQELDRLPRIRSDLHASGTGRERALTLHVHIVNPEAETYVYYVHLKIGDTQSEEPYTADAREFDAWVDVGEADPGAKVLWNVAVWSETLEDWVRAGWQDRRVP